MELYCTHEDDLNFAFFFIGDKKILEKKKRHRLVVCPAVNFFSPPCFFIGDIPSATCQATQEEHKRTYKSPEYYFFFQQKYRRIVRWIAACSSIAER